MKAASKARNRTNRTRKPRKAVPLNVAPVAVQTGDSPDQAFIPATVKSTPNSAEAVISVEVKRGRKVSKRAAVVPVALKRRAGRKPEPQAQPETQQHHLRKQDYRWSDPVTDSVVAAARVLDRVVNLANQFGHTAIDTAEGISRAFFSRAMVVKTVAERGELADLNLVTLAKNPRLARFDADAAHLERRAA